MKSILLIVLLGTGLMADGFTPFAGLAMNASSLKSESPWGVFGAKYVTEYVEVGAKHTSSIPQIDETQGRNDLFINVKKKVGPVEPYVGVAWTNKELTSSYYTDKIGTTQYVTGLVAKYDGKDIYVEVSKPDHGKPFASVGFNLNFQWSDLQW